MFLWTSVPNIYLAPLVLASPVPLPSWTVFDAMPSGTLVPQFLHSVPSPGPSQWRIQDYELGGAGLIYQAEGQVAGYHVNAHIGGILGVCKVNMRGGGGGERGSNLTHITTHKIDPHIFS